MKVGIICYPTYGGSGVVATELGMALAEKGHEVHFISYNRPARLSGSMFMTNIFHHEVRPVDYPLFEYVPYESALASRIVDITLNNGLDILHVHYAVPHASVAYLAKKILVSLGKYIPVVTTLHGSDITLVGKDPSYKTVVEFSLNKSDSITAVSNFLKEETIRNFSINKDVNVIYNFIDLERFKCQYKDHFKRAVAPDDEKVLTHISNFRKVKRVDDVLYTFKEVLERMPAKLLMVGDGPERPRMEALSRELGICKHTLFLGKQEAVDEILSISDVFIMPSGNESFGLSALEAFACHVPVVSSNIGGLPELNIDGETGYLCEVGNINQFAESVMSLFTNEDRLAQFKANARKRAEEFNLSYVLPHYESLYERTIEEAKLTAPNAINVL